MTLRTNIPTRLQKHGGRRNKTYRAIVESTDMERQHWLSQTSDRSCSRPLEERNRGLMNEKNQALRTGKDVDARRSGNREAAKETAEGVAF